MSRDPPPSGDATCPLRGAFSSFYFLSIRVRLPYSILLQSTHAGEPPQHRESSTQQNRAWRLDGDALAAVVGVRVLTDLNGRRAERGCGRLGLPARPDRNQTAGMTCAAMSAAAVEAIMASSGGSTDAAHYLAASSAISSFLSPRAGAGRRWGGEELRAEDGDATGGAAPCW